MPHISSKKLHKDYLQKIYGHFMSKLEGASKKGTAVSFFEDFLTPTEKIMFAKRFAVVYLLSKNLPPSYIAEVLLMSPATIYRMSLNKNIGKYSHAIRSLKLSDEMTWDLFEKIIRMGLPPKVGRGRWKFLYTK
ncbi:MAG: hypothetical protein CO184_00370 [Candidatus Zambryskibacteria bacterium CG_4_9_14_3_um_filter_40_16]|uniref:Uncharacterized protein n=1 Tax=Candidatus Zambryskibacteria bacterium CG_4_9_14_3_um_filter_40_16 TaxID=1975111 RepID=A0A2M7WV95_9BACT|nr:MAG: hypothetical protein CO184_00370 [Candidatus Zambryskibacteria bacterium CG_4_9_14_3_um_filter_40_16]